MSILGTRVVRTEDPRLLTAGGTYVDDLRVPELLGAARATFVRSPVAHALITGLDLSAARAAPGVLAVFTAQDMDDLPPPPPDDGTGSEGAPVPLGGPWAEPLLARDRVRFAGEPVAVVLTDDTYQGEDAAELVSVDYEPLPAVVGFAGALDPPALLFPGTDSNVAVSSGQPADRSALDGCDVVISYTIENQRLAPAPLEGRAAAARWSGGRLTVWLSTQNAQGDHPGHRGLPPDERLPPRADQPDGGRAVPDPARRDRVPGGGDEHHAGLRLPGRRAPRGHGRDRAGRRPVRRRDRHGPGRGPAAQPDPGGQLPLHERERGCLRQRGLCPGPGRGAGRGGLRRAAGGAGPPPRAGRRAAAGAGAGQLRGDHRSRRGRRGNRPARRARGRLGHRVHRQFRARPGPPHGLGHARPGGAGHPDGERHRDPRRHRGHSARRGHLRVTIAATRRGRRAYGRA